MAIASWLKASRIRWQAGPVGGEFIMAAAQVLHEGVTGGEDPRGPVTLQSAHWPQPLSAREHEDPGQRL